MLNSCIFEEMGMICSLCTHKCCDTYSTVVPVLRCEGEKLRMRVQILLNIR